MRLMKWQPSVLSEDLGLERFLGDFFSGSCFPTAGSDWVPRSDVVEHADHYRIELDLPGVEKKNIKISFEKNLLTVRGERKEEKKVESKEYRRMERFQGSFERSFRLPEGVSSDAIEAEYRDGVLQIRVPKAEEALPRAIEVKLK